MNTVRARLVAGVVAFTGVAAGCGGGSGPDRADVVLPLVATYAPEQFAAFATTADELSSAVDTWCAGDGEAPTATVERALTEWYSLKPFWFGPVMDRRSQFIVNFRVDTAGIDELLASIDPVDADRLRDFVGADKRGLGALEYLLATAPDQRRCDYATGVSGLVASEARAVSDAWATFGPALISDEMSANDALREIVSNAVFALREVEKDASPPIERGLLEGAQAATLGEAGRPALTALIDDATVTQLTDEFGAGDAAGAELTLSTTVVSELGITLNFSDADGDG